MNVSDATWKRPAQVCKVLLIAHTSFEYLSPSDVSSACDLCVCYSSVFKLEDCTCLQVTYLVLVISACVAPLFSS